jgi:hypothetical protein
MPSCGTAAEIAANPLGVRQAGRHWAGCMPSNGMSIRQCVGPQVRRRLDLGGPNESYFDVLSQEDLV